MISTESIRTVIGATAYGSAGEKLGTIGQVYLDNASGRPEWATVKTGLFGTRESFVPLADAELQDGGLHLPYGKDQIKGAPNVDADRELSPEEEDALYGYYRLTPEGTSDQAAERAAGWTAGFEEDRSTASGYQAGTIGAGTTGEYKAPGEYETAGTAAAAAGTASDVTGRDTSGPTTDNAMTRSAEQVRAGTETREAGRARLRKYVVTEREQVEVPVSHEEVRLEREPITDENRDRALSGPELSEEEHEIVLTEERPIVEKEAVPVERVRLAKDRVDDSETVDVDVREERIETDQDVERGLRNR